MAEAPHIGDFEEGPRQMFPQRLFEEKAIKQMPLGTHRQLDDGRVFVYCQNGGTELAAGRLATFITTGTNEQTVTVAEAVNDNEITITASGITADLWMDGFLVVTAGTAIGQCYKIRSNSATASGLVTVQLYDKLQTAWVITDTDITIYPCPYITLVVNPVDAQQKPVCCPQRIVTANYFFWGLKKGPGALIMTAANASGLELDEKIVTADTAVAGNGVTTATEADIAGKFVVGSLYAEVDITTNEAALVDFDL